MQYEGGRSQQAREEQTAEAKGEGCGWREARPVRLALVPSRILWIIYNFISTSRIKCKYNSSRFFRNKSHEFSLTLFFHRITGPKNRVIVAARLHHHFRNAFVLARWCSYIQSRRMWKRLNHNKVTAWHMALKGKLWIVCSLKNLQCFSQFFFTLSSWWSKGCTFICEGMKPFKGIFQIYLR